MKANSFHGFQHQSHSSGFTLIELLVVIAIIAILAVVVVLTLNPAQLLAQSRDANRVSDMATLTSALNLYTTDQAGAATFNMGNASDTYISVYDPAATSTNNCPSLGLAALNASSGQAWLCASSSSYRTNAAGWIPVNLSQISAGSPIGNLPVDPTNQTSTGLFYAYNTNGPQFEVTADLESQKYKAQYGNVPQTTLFPEVVSGGNPTISALFNPAGLIGYWPMDEGSGSSTIDVSGNGNNGTWSGTPSGSNSTYYIAGKVGAYAADFNGSNDFVSVGSSTLLSPSSFTISLWVNPKNIANSPLLILNASSSGWEILLLSNGTQWRVQNVGGSGSAGTYTIAPPLNAWSLITMTYSPGTALFYENGSPASAANSVTLNTPNGPFIIGVSSLNGSIDDLRLYNRTLSPAEIMALYDAEK
jgi:prepilin-type N-terminal cleavage/methylation domain-containing protein